MQAHPSSPSSDARCAQCGAVHGLAAICHEPARKAPVPAFTRYTGDLPPYTRWHGEAVIRAGLAPTQADRLIALRLISTDGLSAHDLEYVERFIARATDGAQPRAGAHAAGDAHG